jgi:hypothetical protein
MIDQLRWQVRHALTFGEAVHQEQLRIRKRRTQTGDFDARQRSGGVGDVPEVRQSMHPQILLQQQSRHRRHEG